MAKFTQTDATTGQTKILDYPYSKLFYIKLHFATWAGLLYNIQKDGKTYNITDAQTSELLYIIK